MKNLILLFNIILIFGCTQHESNLPISKTKNYALIADTKMLKSLHDSLNLTGNLMYYEKYILKINEMIKKYPEKKDLVKVKEGMIEIFEND